MLHQIAATAADFISGAIWHATTAIRLTVDHVITDEEVEPLRLTNRIS
jgi:hypothetical protein